MVRGLVIRQGFMIVDLVLGLLVIVTVGIVVQQMLEAPRTVEAVPGMTGTERARTVQFALEVGPREAYNSITSSGLFGDAGRMSRVAEPRAIEEEPAGIVEDTSLNLRLLGTIALSPQDPFAAAFIEDRDQRFAQGYGLGDEVVEKVKLAEVYQREVYLLNERNTPPTKERLRMDEEADAPGTASPPKRLVSASPSTAERVALNRQEFIQELYTNYADLVTKVKPEMYRDENGKVIGVTAPNISQVSLARKLGLQDGDVLTTVNNDSIDSEQKIMEVVQKYRSADAFRIGILRNGKPKVITYSLK